MQEDKYEEPNWKMCASRISDLRVSDDGQQDSVYSSDQYLHDQQQENATSKGKKKKNNILQQLNSSAINKSTIAKFNKSFFDFSIIEKDKSILINKLNRTLISCQEINNINRLSDSSTTNINRLYTSFDETKNITLTCLQSLSDRDKILKFCTPNYTTKFEKILKSDKQIEKLDEGSFGEIYKYKESSNGNNDSKTIIKVIKVEEDDLDQLLSEVLVSFTLNELQKDFKFENFIRIKRCCLVEDRYPNQLLNAWNLYNNQVKMSENENPMHFDQNANFVVLFLEDGGKNLETAFDNELLEPEMALSIFKQVLLSLAIAEYSIQFEHRDLHLGNILVNKTKENQITYKLNDKVYKIDTGGVKIKIIDYTLSRFSKNKVIVYLNLNECPEIFNGKGDAQYDVYRKMRKVNNGEWSAFCPKTNILWLEYLGSKLEVVGRTAKRRGPEEKKMIFALRAMKSHLKKFDSCLSALDLLK